MIHVFFVLHSYDSYDVVGITFTLDFYPELCFVLAKPLVPGEGALHWLRADRWCLGFLGHVEVQGIAKRDEGPFLVNSRKKRVAYHTQNHILTPSFFHLSKYDTNKIWFLVRQPLRRPPRARLRLLQRPRRKPRPRRRPRPSQRWRLCRFGFFLVRCLLKR